MTNGPTAENVAFAQPRLRPLDGGLVALPRPLSALDAARVRRIFANHQAGDLPAARQDLAALENQLLMGTLLADRYLRRPEDASLPELQDWFARYMALPDGPAIRALLVARLPRNAAPPPAVITTDPALDHIDPEDRLALDQPRNPMLDRAVHDQARSGHADLALRLINKTTGLSQAYAGVLRAEIAQMVFFQGNDDKAAAIAQAAQVQANGTIALASYVGGLARWRQDRPDLAAELFEQASRAPVATPSLHAAAAFWAARANLRNRNPAAYRPWMRRAAAEPRTFFGLLARRALGLGIGFAPDKLTLGEADVAAVAALPAGLRAFALLQVEQPARAAAELRALWDTTGNNFPLGRSLLLVARAAGLTDLAAELASLQQMRDGQLHDDARFPLPNLVPRGGFRIDPALLYALARTESNFDSKAISPAGARGLMQIMPVTASYLAGAENGETLLQHLHDPAFNLDIGQRYLTFLASYQGIGGDLIRMLASYNAGPGNLEKWAADSRDGGDPLLFIESIPFDETRSFVQRVLTYSWLYGARLGMPARSLDELAAGAWPRFHTGTAREFEQFSAQLH